MKRLVFLIALLISQISIAQIDRKGNGGDICENKFKIIRDDIRDWIYDGGSAGLVLPVSMKLSQYNSEMLNKITNAQISCVDEAVKIRSTEKTCINFFDNDGSLQIVCNRTRFLSAMNDDQYVLVHHEYAGLAGFEVNFGVSSDYTISNQLSQYLQDVVVRKLGIKPTATQMQETPFSKLRNLYLTATAPAKVADFPLADENTSMKCGHALKGDENINQTSNVPRLYQARSGGPEFPGKTIVMFLKSDIWYSVLQGTIRDTKMTLTDTDLVSSLQAIPRESLGRWLDTPAKYYFRKSTTGYIVGKADFSIGKPTAYTMYFYCWN